MYQNLFVDHHLVTLSQVGLHLEATDCNWYAICRKGTLNTPPVICANQMYERCPLGYYTYTLML